MSWVGQVGEEARVVTVSGRVWTASLWPTMALKVWGRSFRRGSVWASGDNVMSTAETGSA